jgi:molybdopterin biosynthesis enzyme
VGQGTPTFITIHPLNPLNLVDGGIPADDTPGPLIEKDQVMSSPAGTTTTTTEEHPMVPVPEAIRTVLRETARIVMTPNAKTDPTLKLSPFEAPEKSIGLVLDEDVIMGEPGYPPYNASIMDGYAIRTSEAVSSDHQTWTHHVLDRIYAGDEQLPKLAVSENSGLPPAYYITTGAVVPDGYNCVVPIEEIEVSNEKDKIRILPSATIKPNTWIRPIGCDIPANSVVLPKGATIDPVALGLIKQSGVEFVTIKRPLVVGVLSTGNELIGTNNTSQSGMIPDVNRPILLNLLSTFGDFCQPLDLGNERDDDIQAMARTIDKALEKCDVIITTGGISMGESDIVEQVLVDHSAGTLHFGRLHMKPGTC